MRLLAPALALLLPACYPWINEAKLQDDLENCTWYPDEDGDGFGDGNVLPVDSCRNQGEGWVRADNSDCRDDDPLSFPGAPELCDDLDNDCDGMVDEDLSYSPYYPDTDGDDFGNMFSPSKAECRPPDDHWITEGGDCDDDDASVNPGIDEICNNIDDDCDGVVDDDLPTSVYFPDVDGDGWGDGSSPSQAMCGPNESHWLTQGRDCNDTDASQHPDAEEVCNGEDDDCDGTIDENPVDPRNWYLDSDNDDHGDPNDIHEACDRPPNHVAIGDDCDDYDPTRFPGNPEVCDGVDNDCVDGLPEEETDDDGDTRVECLIEDGHWKGSHFVTGGSDCNDVDDTALPGAPELCDGQDNDCDGILPDDESDDEADGGDGYVECAFDEGGWDGIDSVLGGGDCDDTNDAAWPGATEIWYDGIDQDCDPSNEYDADGDGYDSSAKIESGDDCDDDDPDMSPGADEIWYDGIDQDCDGASDNDADRDGQDSAEHGGLDCNDDDDTVFDGASELCDGQLNDCNGAMLSTEVDADGDGFVVCIHHSGGWDGPDSVIGGGDCNDSDSTRNPGMTELCDGIDNNCDDLLPGVERDLDEDGYVECELEPGGWQGQGEFLGGDCDNSRADVYPGADEYCDGVDHDCDTLINEDDSLDTPVWYLDDDEDGYGYAFDWMEMCFQPSGYVNDGRDCDDSDPGVGIECAYIDISLGYGGKWCALRGSGLVECNWGTPPGGGFVDIAVDEHDQQPGTACGLRSHDGDIECWGERTIYQTGSFTAVTLGGSHGSGLMSDGSAKILYSHSTDPELLVHKTGPFVQIEAGGNFMTGLYADGSTTSWGNCDYHCDGNIDLPPGTYTYVNAALRYTCGLLEDGDIVCVGSDDERLVGTYSGPFIDLSAGLEGMCALHPDRSVECWDYRGYQHTWPSGGSYLQIDIGDPSSPDLPHFCGIQTDGELHCQ